MNDNVPSRRNLCIDFEFACALHTHTFIKPKAKSILFKYIYWIAVENATKLLCSVTFNSVLLAATLDEYY